LATRQESRYPVTEYPEQLFPFLLTRTDRFTLQPSGFLVRGEAPNLKLEVILGASAQVAVMNDARQRPNND
jgi:hypothetical protein